MGTVAAVPISNPSTKFAPLGVLAATTTTLPPGTTQDNGFANAAEQSKDQEDVDDEIVSVP